MPIGGWIGRPEIEGNWRSISTCAQFSDTTHHCASSRRGAEKFVTVISPSLSSSTREVLESISVKQPNQLAEVMRVSNDTIYPFRLQSQVSNFSPSKVFGTIFSDNFQLLDVPNKRCPAGLATKDFIRMVSGLSSPSQHNLAS